MEKQQKLSERIEAELRSKHAQFDVHPDRTGYVNEMCELYTDSFYLEFRITGYLRFYSEFGERDPQHKVEIRNELGLQGIGVYDDDGLIEIEEKGFEKEMDELLLGVFLNQNW